MRVLVVNAGSSSLKLRLLGPGDEPLEARDLDGAPSTAAEAELAAAIGELGEADAVGHRIVHGGTRFDQAVRLDSAVLDALRELGELAPLHQPAAIAAAEAARAALPELPAVACFDTAFHASLPEDAATYALPAEWRSRWGLRRYGFHGLSHSYVGRRAPQLLGEASAGLRIVSCHLGAGASACAIRDGRSLDTTMGFTPLEGLVMATRSGSVDPGLLLWLLRTEALTVAKLEEGLEHRSGLLGLGGSADTRELLRLEEGGDEAASLALRVYVHRLRGAIATMSAALGGIDVLAFTGGVGEGATEVRRRVADGLAYLGIGVDEEANRATRADAEITGLDASVRVLVIRAREDLEIAAQVRSLLSTEG